MNYVIEWYNPFRDLWYTHYVGKEENANEYKTMLKKAGMKEITMFEDLVR